MSKVKQASMFRIQISSVKGAEWDRYFVGMPNRSQLLAVLDLDATDKPEGVSDDVFRERSKTVRELRQIAEDNYPKEPVPQQWTRDLICHYAGVRIGCIRVHRMSRVVVEVGV